MEKKVIDKEFRYERKYVIPSFDNNTMINFLNCDSSPIKNLYPKRIVNSIYFDTVNLNFMRQNIEGYKDRVKVRIRYYGMSNLPKSLVLEFKCKDGLVGWKEIYALDDNNISKLSSFNSIYNLFCSSKLPLDKLNILKNLIPTLFCTYERSYFSCFDDQIRITFDENIKFASLFGTTEFLSIRNKLLNYPKKIMELKYPVSAYEQSLEIIKNIPIELPKHSKYIEGLYYTGIINWH